MFIGVVVLFWILNGGVLCEKCVKKHVGILRDLLSIFFLKPLFLFWQYLGLETSKWNDSN